MFLYVVDRQEEESDRGDRGGCPEVWSGSDYGHEVHARSEQDQEGDQGSSFLRSMVNRLTIGFPTPARMRPAPTKRLVSLPVTTHVASATPITTSPAVGITHLGRSPLLTHDHSSIYPVYPSRR